jgi:hypothetical protein
LTKHICWQKHGWCCCILKPFAQLVCDTLDEIQDRCCWGKTDQAPSKHHLVCSHQQTSCTTSYVIYDKSSLLGRQNCCPEMTFSMTPCGRLPDFTKYTASQAESSPHLSAPAVAHFSSLHQQLHWCWHSALPQSSKRPATAAPSIGSCTTGRSRPVSRQHQEQAVGHAVTYTM